MLRTRNVIVIAWASVAWAGLGGSDSAAERADENLVLNLPTRLEARCTSSSLLVEADSSSFVQVEVGRRPDSMLTEPYPLGYHPTGKPPRPTSRGVDVAGSDRHD
jgi:hypothetical protein